MLKKIIIGTRGSKLALIQAYLTKERLENAGIKGIEIKIIKTKGDLQLDKPLSGKIDKGFFTSEIENELLENQIDIAVHSLKDLPTDIHPQLTIGAYLERASVNDVFISKDGRSLSQMNDNDTIATSSTRRIAQLKNRYPHINIIDIRGNIDTRLKKLKEGYASGIILAAAGMERIGLENKITEYLDIKEFIPAAGQGAIAIQCRMDDSYVLKCLEQINHNDTQLSVEAERYFLHLLEGGCHIPAGCVCIPLENYQFEIIAFKSNPDGSNKKLISKTVHELDLKKSIANIVDEMK